MTPDSMDYSFLFLPHFGFVLGFTVAMGCCPHAVHAEHGHNGDYLLATGQLPSRGQNGFSQARVHRQL